ncbi:hypothetical protein IWQ60_008077 [Tieghemiomyces parasiticus]|uniref:Uncharacterized protein n=1 Tax=Tieghemiomyces parasiticus TaxID=78921 RepID=A0A9W7ZUN9_9FUNG|nr:hypothetical protein IWQ60_008077 [Tieghemiomyces parasiticus]
MSKFLIELGLFVAFPAVVSLVLGLVRGKPDGPSSTSPWHVRRREAFRVKDGLLYALVGVTVLSQVYSGLFKPPPNLFRTLDVSIKAPQHQLRNHWKQYADKQRFAANGAAFYPAGEDLPSAYAKASPDFDKFTYAHGTPYGRLDTLVDRLKVKGNRMLYGAYGEEALLDCTWCQTGSDYVTYVTSSLVAGYLWMALLVMIHGATPTTFSPRRQDWRTYLLSFLVVLFFIDYWVLLIDPDGRESVWPFSTLLDAVPSPFESELAARERHLFGFQTSHTLRCMAFTILSVTLVALDFVQSNAPTEPEMLQAAVAQAQVSLQRLQALQIQRTAVLRDQELRKRLIAHHKAEQVRHRRARKDPEFSRLYRAVVEGPDVDSLINEAHRYVNNVLEAATPGGEGYGFVSRAFEESKPDSEAA